MKMCFQNSRMWERLFSSRYNSIDTFCLSRDRSIAQSKFSHYLPHKNPLIPFCICSAELGRIVVIVSWLQPPRHDNTSPHIVKKYQKMRGNSAVFQDLLSPSCCGLEWTPVLLSCCHSRVLRQFEFIFIQIYSDSREGLRVHPQRSNACACQSWKCCTYPVAHLALASGLDKEPLHIIALNDCIGLAKNLWCLSPCQPLWSILLFLWRVRLVF